jgi:hypothetical protein
MDWVTISMFALFVVGCLLLFVSSRVRKAFDDETIMPEAGFEQARTEVIKNFDEEAQEVTESLQDEDPEETLADIVNRNRRRK